MREKKHKIIKWIVMGLIVSGVLVQGVLTGRSHIKTGKYSSDSWEVVWPVIVSTFIAVFGTLVTSKWSN